MFLTTIGAASLAIWLYLVLARGAFWRMRPDVRHPALPAAGVATIANDVNYGVAVNNLSRQEFVVGTTTANVAFGPLQGYQVNNSVPPPPTIFPAPDSIINNGGKDVSLVGIQWNDVFVTPSVVNFPAVGVGQAAPPAQTVNTADFAGNPVACTFSAPGAPFTIVAAPSTGQYTVTVSNANPGVFQAFSTFNCGGGFDNVTVLTLNEVVSGPLRSEERRVGKECRFRWRPD